MSLIDLAVLDREAIMSSQETPEKRETMAAPGLAFNTEKMREVILHALENSNYDWRTIDGLSRETNLQPSTIQGVLDTALAGDVVVSGPNEKGQALYTTRRHYREHAGKVNRFLTAASNTFK